MRIAVENPPHGNGPGDQLWGMGSCWSQVRALVYLSDPDLPLGRATRVRKEYGIGILTFVNGNGLLSESVEIEMREQEMAEFCRAYLAVYEEEHGERVR